MALYTVQDVISDFALTYQGVPDALELQLYNQVDIEINRAFGFKKKTLNIPLIEGEAAYAIDPSAVWIEKARYIDQPNGTTQGFGGWMLQETNVDEMDTEDIDWRAFPERCPHYAMITSDLTGGQISFESPAIATTLLVTDATYATPVVITSSAAHNLDDGNRVDLVDILGNTTANGHYYAKVTGYSSTTFALYEDPELTGAIIGNALYAGGGLISCAGSPYLQVFTRWHDELTVDDFMPDSPLYIDLWSNGMRYYYACKRVLADVPAYQAIYKDKIAAQMEILQKRGGRKPMRIRTVGVRPQNHLPRPSCGRW